MTTEIDYSAVLVDINRRRHELDGAAAAIQRIIQSCQPGESIAKTPHPAETKSPKSKVVKFKDWTIWRAAHQFLLNAGKPQTTRQIMDGLLAGGLETRAKHFDANLYTMLSSRPHVFRRVDAGVWGLIEWES